jgi:hypothetical protein
MKNKQKNPIITTFLVAALLLAVSHPVPATAGVNAKYLYRLSNFSGTVPYDSARSFVDEQTNEIFVVTAGYVSIFNESGMEIFTFGEDLELGAYRDAAVESDGRILLLSYEGDNFRLTRMNFRGEPQSMIEISNLPGEFGGFSPTRILSRNGNLYLVDLYGKKIAVTDSNGVFREGYDIAPFLVEPDNKSGDEKTIRSFTVDKEGNLFFTVPELFRVFRLSPDREIASFGEPGNLPGKFNIVSGVAVDDWGYIYVTDTLRCVVAVFDRDFNFLTQFSQRGVGPGNLIAPKELSVDKKGRVYVSQARRRGISVFKVTFN